MLLVFNSIYGTWELKENVFRTYAQMHFLIIWDFAVWGASIGEHLVHKHTKGPDVRGGGIAMLT